MAGDVGILGEETVFMRDSLVIQHGADHVQVRNQDGLRDLGGELVIAFADARPDARRGFAERFRIELGEIQHGLEAVVKLVSLQTAHRNAAEQVVKVLLAQLEEDIGKLHQSYCSGF